MRGDMITIDNWDGALNHEETIEAPTAEDFDRLLDRLDAKRHTMLALGCQGEHHMVIGGGAGQYVVYATRDNCEFWNLLREEEEAEGTVMLTSGGQEGDFPAVHVVDKERARAAGRAFLASGWLEPTLRWAPGDQR